MMCSVAPFLTAVQCFTDAECGGSKVPVASARECCVETDYGLSFGDDETCTTCLGTAANCTWCCEALLYSKIRFEIFRL